MYCPSPLPYGDSFTNAYSTNRDAGSNVGSYIIRPGTARARAMWPSRGMCWCGRPSNTPSRTSEKSVNFVHRKQHYEVHRRRLRDWGYALAKKEFGAVERTAGPGAKQPPEGKPGAGIVIKDSIADITLQQPGRAEPVAG